MTPTQCRRQKGSIPETGVEQYPGAVPGDETLSGSWERALQVMAGFLELSVVLRLIPANLPVQTFPPQLERFPPLVYLSLGHFSSILSPIYTLTLI